MSAGGVLVYRIRRCPVRIRRGRGRLHLTGRTGVLCLRLGHDRAILQLTRLRGGILTYRATTAVLITTTAAVLRGLIAGRLAVLACLAHLPARGVIARLTVSTVKIVLIAGRRILVRALAYDGGRAGTGANAGTGGSGGRVLIADSRRGTVLIRLIGNIDGLIREIRLR